MYVNGCRDKTIIVIMVTVAVTATVKIMFACLLCVWRCTKNFTQMNYIHIKLKYYIEQVVIISRLKTNKLLI